MELLLYNQDSGITTMKIVLRALTMHALYTLLVFRAKQFPIYGNLVAPVDDLLTPDVGQCWLSVLKLLFACSEYYIA